MGSSARTARQRSADMALGSIRRKKTLPTKSSRFQFGYWAHWAAIKLGGLRTSAPREQRQRRGPTEGPVFVARTKHRLRFAKRRECRRERIVRCDAAFENDIAARIDHGQAVVRHQRTIHRGQCGSMAR